MATEDPLTPGEIRRAFERSEAADKALGDRITQVASDALPTKLWAAEHRALTEKVDRHEKDAEEDRKRLEQEIGGIRQDVKEIREERDKRSEITWTKVIGLIGAAAALGGVVISALALTKGIK